MNVVVSVFEPSKTYPGQKQFDCGNAIINKFVRDSLKAQVRKHLSVAYVLTDKDNGARFVGFFTIAQHMLPGDLLSDQERGKMPRQVPCTRLVMLGVDNNYQQQRLGSRLMKEAFNATKRAAAAVGSFGVYLDADPSALGFYEKLGFVLLDGDKTPNASPMFLDISAIP